MALPITFNGTQQDLDDFCAALNYTGKATDGSAETKPQFFTRKLKEFAAGVVRTYRADAARQAITAPTF